MLGISLVGFHFKNVLFHNFFTKSTVKLRSTRLAAAANASDAASCVRTEVESSDTESDGDLPDLAEVTDSSAEESSDDSEESEDEDLLHGVCGGKVCGADAPPPQLRTYLGEYVAKEFEVEGQEHPSLFWGKVVKYLPQEKDFAVS